MSKPAAFAPEALGWVTLTSHLERGTSEILEDHEKTIAAKSERPNTEGQQISAIERHPPLDSVKEDKHVAPIAGEKGRLAEERQAEEQDWSLAQRDQTMSLLIDFPSCVNPLDCINADANHINGIVQGLLALTQRGEFRHAVFAGSMIYRRLIVYIYAHLMLCTSEKRFLNEFEETLQQWRDWDNITVVQNHRLIKDHLYDIFHRGLKVQVYIFLVNQFL
ncbi:hypothetical protein PILCRDRAFT_610850 [Piloderma croceum F 1598]|uniref:Uncharacterized protein n=1 Tax=Piloderma croceum (strain F 1598) TaxID=765440 RepID=A0A0C3FDA4_PILCF|nr:hypothetical protein PILCRDRAFT_610850 [Piloderma croceum F 1598]